MNFLTRLFSGKRPEASPVYAVPPGHLLYAVGDIHGRFDLLEQLIDLLAADRRQREGVEKCTLIFLGDYVDRGFHSSEVVEKLCRLQLDWAEVICLKGNHEMMMLEFITDPVASEGWLHYGGLATLASYGVKLAEASPGQTDLLRASEDLAKKVPRHHMDFLRDAQHTHRVGDYLFVHAGIRPGIGLKAQDPYDLMSIRQEFTESKLDFGVRVVHGHTGVQNPLVLPNRIAVDTIAYATGRLTAVVLHDDFVDFVTT